MLNLLERTKTITTNVSKEFNFSLLPTYEINKYKNNNYKLAKKCEDGVIFHAWNWYFNDVKNNIKDIAHAGFTSIQVSPVQPTKDNNLKNTWDWWQFYQPIDFTIGNTLGTAHDFKKMCDEAKKYGIKIIVDVVTNHLANNTGKGNHAKWDRHDKIPSYLKDNDYFWHNECNGAFNNNDWDRTSMTQGSIGMPGLNTKNKELQHIIINFLNSLQDLGADGFRFDAAKHIELPEDSASSDFWPTITNGIKSKKSDSFIYGEILNGCGTDIKNYTKYIKVTDNEYGWNVLDSVLNCNAGLAQNYIKQDKPTNLITWVESHDTYAGDYGRKTDSVSDLDIRLGWCILAARADSIPLFYGRPSEGLNCEIGGPGNVSWKNEIIASVNKFHNHFAGESEYIRILNYNSVFEIERGDSGVVIVNLSHNYNKIYTETNLKDGEYIDKVTGNIVTVSNGHLSAELSGKSVIVAYKESALSKRNFISIKLEEDYVREGYLYASKPENWGEHIYAYVYSENGSNKRNIQNWPGIKMKCQGNRYYLPLPAEWQNDNTQVIFNDGHNQIPMAYCQGEYYKIGTAMLFKDFTIKKILPNKNMQLLA